MPVYKANFDMSTRHAVHGVTNSPLIVQYYTCFGGYFDMSMHIGVVIHHLMVIITPHYTYTWHYPLSWQYLIGSLSVSICNASSIISQFHYFGFACRVTPSYTFRACYYTFCVSSAFRCHSICRCYLLTSCPVCANKSPFHRYHCCQGYYYCQCMIPII